MVHETWSRMFSALLIAFPNWVLKRLQEKSNNTTTVIKVIPFLILALSITSIFIIDGKVTEYHGGLLGFGIGLAVACLVPVGVLAAMLINSRWAWVFWGLAALFAVISGTIQYTTYQHAKEQVDQFNQLLAIALGYGLPVSEVALAIMESCLIAQHNAKLAKDAQIAKDTIALQAQQEADRVAALARRETEAKQQEQERELKLKRDQELHDLKLQQDKALFETKLDITRQKAYAKIGLSANKSADKLAAKSADQPIVPAATGDTANQPMEKADQTADLSANFSSQLQMLSWYTVEPTLSDDKIAKRLGKSKQYAQRLLADLAAKEVVKIEKVGKGKTVTINGKYEAFKRGGTVKPSKHFKGV